MNSSFSRKTYGILPLSAEFKRGVQLEWAMVESPAPRARFLNFPLADEAPVPMPPKAHRRIAKEKRPLAA